MSRIEEMLAELCPNGVEYRPIGDFCLKAKSIKWADVKGEARFYIDLASVDVLTGRISTLVEISESNAPSRARQLVVSGDVLFATTRPTQMRCCLVPESLDGHVCSTGYCVLRVGSEALNNHYLLHVLKTADFKGYLEANQSQGNYPAISDRQIRDYEIPVPPMEIQQEIVRILDSFAELEAELEAGLEAELEARRRQYAYYRDKLLGFDREREFLG